MARPVLQIVTASTRTGRKGPALARWVQRVAEEHGAFAVESIDLAEAGLPLLDEPNHPRLQQYTLPHTKDWSATIARADARSSVGGALGASLVMAWMASRNMLATEGLLDAALVYEVAMALFISITVYSVPLHTDAYPRGWSGVAVWTLAFPLVVPSTRGKTILSTIAASAMDPIGLGLQVAAGQVAPHGAAAWVMFLPSAIAAATGIIVSRIVYQMNVDAEKGHEMGSYHLEELLGSGGMGEVWKASHRLLARPAAIKLIRPDSSGSDGRESIKRFEREVQAAAGLQSPHTVNV